MKKTVLITGANRGLGLEFVRKYACIGFKVFATCRNPANAAELRQVSGDIEILRLDVTSIAEIECISNQLTGVPVDILINNAGMHGPRDHSATFGRIDVAAWLEVIRVNSIAPVKIAEALIKNVVSSELKKIVFISSLAGSIAFRGSQTHHRTGGPYIYRTSKAALNASAKAIGFDQQANGVSVVVLHPGWVKTETGGWDASGNAEDSVAAMVDLIHLATPENNGKFLNFDGKELSW